MGCTSALNDFLKRLSGCREEMEGDCVMPSLVKCSGTAEKVLLSCVVECPRVPLESSSQQPSLCFLPLHPTPSLVTQTQQPPHTTTLPYTNTIINNMDEFLNLDQLEPSSSSSSSQQPLLVNPQDDETAGMSFAEMFRQ